MKAYTYSSVALAVMVTLLGGCGGGGGSSNNPPVATTPTTPVTSEPEWEAGVYEPQSQFIAKCETPRSGIDPFTGRAYPDTQGTAMDEKLWLRSWTNDTYLWYDEVDDNDPENFSVLAYFDQLKTTELTPSGTPKDNFHFSQDTAEYNELSQSGISSGYGFDWEFGSTTVPRQLTVRFTEPGSPAALAEVPRGAKVLSINGVDFVNDNTQQGVDAINAALFPDDAGTTANFEFELVDGTTTSVEITSGDISVTPVQNVKVLETERGKVGYFQFNTFIVTAQEGLINAFDTFVEQNVTELVMDLRYNGGGRLALASQLSYMVAGPNVYADDVDIAENGKVYFTDATTKFSAKAFGGTLNASLLEILEHRGNGRLIEYTPSTGKSKVIMDGLVFANGVAVSHDQASVLVNETGNYRVLRYWLGGPRSGQVDIVIDNLPGFPDNISAARNGGYYVGLASPRSSAVDKLADSPFLRKIVQRLPKLLRPQGQAYGHLIKISERGEIELSLQDPTGAIETDEELYISSLTATAVGVLGLKE